MREATFQEHTRKTVQLSYLVTEKQNHPLVHKIPFAVVLNASAVAHNSLKDANLHKVHSKYGLKDLFVLKYLHNR